MATDNDSSGGNSGGKNDEEKLGFLHVVMSVMAAAFGVQSKKNQAKDFSSKNNIYIYITAGLVFTTLFVFVVYAVVKTVLKNAGM